MEYFIVRRGGHHYYESFLKNISFVSWPEESDFGSFKNAHKFFSLSDARAFIKKHEGDFQGSVIRTDGGELYDELY